MRVAFRTASIPGLDFQATANTAKDLGFDGIELHAAFDPSAAVSTNILFTDPQKIRRTLAESSIAVSSVSLVVGRDAGQLSRVIESAVAIGSTTVRVLRANVVKDLRGFDRFAATVFSAADTAAGAGVILLLENEPITGAVARLWRAVDGFNHPSIAVCWSPDNGRVAGELPLVSIPTLNSRIRMVRFGDAITPEIPAKKILERLAGIGFDGWLLVDGNTEAGLRDQQSQLRSTLTSLNPPLAASRTKTH